MSLARSVGKEPRAWAWPEEEKSVRRGISGTQPQTSLSDTGSAGDTCLFWLAVVMGLGVCMWICFYDGLGVCVCVLIRFCDGLGVHVCLCVSVCVTGRFSVLVSAPAPESSP